MALFEPLKRSLRIRLAVGTVAVLLPFLALSVGSFFFLGDVYGKLQGLVNRSAEEVLPISRLKTLILESALPLQSHLISGSPREREAFARTAAQVDQLLDELAPRIPADAVNGRLLQAVRQEWEKARDLAPAILELPGPPPPQRAVRLLDRFGIHVARAEDILDRLYLVAEGNWRGQWAAIQGAKEYELGAVMSLIWVCLVLVVWSGYAMVRSVSVPLTAFKRMADRMGQGDLSARVSLYRQDELGQLAAAFNRMAGELEKSQQRLTHLSVHDELTGLFNRREFQNQLDNELERGDRFGQGFSLLMVDVDHFKVVNDTYGHPIGDDVLKAVADTISGEVRALDRVARFGGEEFIAVLPGTSAEGALALAERIRNAVAARKVRVGARDTVRLTVSVGLAIYPDDGTSSEALLNAVDRALYAAKEGGRNRVSRIHTAA